MSTASLCRFLPAFAAAGLALFSARLQAQEAGWINITGTLQHRLTNGTAVPQAYPGGCSGVLVNRTNGDVTIKVVGSGLWRSTDQGTNWARVDSETISGRDETGWATTADAGQPGRIASFSLDGSAGWTADGVHWRKFADLGRNWDFGSVDWAADEPRVIIGARHETTPPGEVYVTQDGGLHWKLLDVHLGDNRNKVFMVGAMGGSSLIYGNGDGIHRSTDLGATWGKVSAINPQTRIPVLFHGAHYLGGTNGLVVSRDQGVTWQGQGTAVDIWQGPFFGRDETEMMVVGKSGAFITRDSGGTWTRVATLKPKEGGFLFTSNWFGCYAWDPIHGFLYASSMGNPVYRLKL